MATAREVVETSLRLLNIKAAEQPIDSVMAQDGLESLNDMCNEWEVAATSIGFETVDSLDDELFIEDGFLSAVKANLALYMAPEYQNAVVTPALIRRAKKGWSAIRANVPGCPVEYPRTLPVGVGNEGRISGANGDTAGNLWVNRFFRGNRDCN